MLTLMMRPGDRVFIGDDIILKYFHKDGVQIHVGFEAPKSIKILRESVKLRKEFLNKQHNGNK